MPHRTAPDPAEADAYPPIGDYAIVGDGRSVALVSSRGSVDFLCWPNFDSPSLFAALLDAERGGSFRLAPATPPRRVTRRYLPGTAVLETTHETEDGTLRVTDAMAIVPETDLAPVRLLVRVAEAVDGAPRLLARYAPRPDYARRVPRLRERSALGWFADAPLGAVALRAEMDLLEDPGLATLTGETVLSPGERRRFALAFSGDEPMTVLPFDAVDEALSTTTRFWQGWTARLAYDGPLRDAVTRSAITLKLLTFAPSGAVLAAGTTSLPEDVGGSLNWDYRYCWLRDAALTLTAFMDLGCIEEGERFIGWLLHATRLTAPRLRPLYNLHGRIDLDERELPHLSGYRDSRPVRVGNAAHGQRQLDVYGMVALAAHEFVRRGGTLDRASARHLAAFGPLVCACWQEPDAGIWEVRGVERRHTHSALMCWTALDCLIALADAGHLRVDRKRLADTREAIRRTIEEEAWSEKLGAYSGIVGEDALDSSLLVMARTGFCDPQDPRLARTHDALRERLGRGPLLRRYDDRFHPFAAHEASFAMCAFWEIDYLVRRGDLDLARARLEALACCASDLGLYAEEIDQASGAPVGNFPQAFTHAGLVNAALLLDAALAARAPQGRPNDPAHAARFAPRRNTALTPR